ncbi:hypothetical protein A6V29_14740 [Blastococcus sp. CCUG 61487]|nr:hypothetical protein A6V29_14740 [Blastococcus sp. CCUG 61487]
MPHQDLQDPSGVISATEVLRLISEGGPFGLIRHENSSTIDVLLGSVTTLDALSDVPSRTRGAPGPDVLLLVPYRQITERGFVAHDDGAPLVCLQVERHLAVEVSDFVERCPQPELSITDTTYDLDDEQYGEIVRRIVADEIGEGEGANFVVRRTLEGQIEDWSTDRALGVFRNLLLNEVGAYWTFCIQTPERTLIGASPERHISSRSGTVTMNPISGTFRMPSEDISDVELQERLVAFLSDEKERLELMMVVDEELKMMAALCPDGGRVIGPLLKPMSHLVHTEYMLEGTSKLDPRDLLRGSMFAATVLGSPVENACRVVKRYEASGRGYYGAVLAEIGWDEQGQQYLDAPIVIRTADIDPQGRLRVGVGATLVRDSVPEEEVAETKSKLAGLLVALGMAPARSRRSRHSVHELIPPDDPRLTVRNEQLSPFWLNESPFAGEVSDLAGRTVELVSAEDDFSIMLAHMLRRMGMRVHASSWREGDERRLDADVLLVGPGPGDPRATDSPRMAELRRLVAERLHEARPLVAVCLGHQVLADALGFELRHKRAVVQGAQEEIELFGRRELAGFYNTFTAVLPRDGRGLPFDCAVDGDEVVAIRGPGFASMQFHAESVLTPRGYQLLADTVLAALAPDRSSPSSDDQPEGAATVSPP